MYDLSKNIPLLTSLVAKGVATYAVADPVAGATVTLASAGIAVAKAFAPDVTEHFISVFEYNKFKEFLIKTHPGDLNHDLDKLIKDAMKRAVGFIKLLYLEKLKADAQLTFWQKFKAPFAEIEEVLSAMERDLSSQLSATTFQKDDLDNYLSGNHTDCLEQLTHYLFSVSGVDENDQEWQQLRRFFREELAKLFDLSFKEALKDEANSKAFKAFEIWILEEGLKNQKQLLSGQATILAELDKLKTNQYSPGQALVLQQLESDVALIPILISNQFNIVLAQLNRIEGKIDKLVALGEAPPPSPHIIPKLLTTIPTFGGDFVGRQDELKQLRATLTLSAKVVLMNGLGGIGKTSLAKWYVQHHHQEYDHIGWIDVTKQDTTVKGKLVSGSIREAVADDVVLFKNLGISYNPKEDPAEQRFALIMNALSNLAGRNLLVIDNAGADASEKAIRNLLPHPPNWRVLLTSRQKLNGYTLLPLDKLDEPSAKELFYRYYTYASNPDEVSDLLASIDYHTLTVELFAKTLEEHHGSLSVADLLQKVKSKTLKDPDLQRKVETEHHPDETEIFLHLMLAFDCAELTAEEQHILSQLALLPPVPYSPKEQLAPWLGYVDNAQQRILDETLIQLTKKGWLTQANHAYLLHRLLQQVVSYQIELEWDKTKLLVKSIANILRVVDNPEALKVYPLRVYGEFLLTNIPEDYYDKYEISLLKNNLALVYQDLGRYAEAAQLLEAALNSTEDIFGPNHPTVATTQSNLALVYQDLGRYDKAAQLLEEALNSDQENFGPNHPTVATRQSNLALVYKDLGRYDEATRLLEEALNSAEDIFGPNHPTVAINQSNLALVYQDLGRYEEAAKLLESTLNSNQENFDPNHPNVAKSQSNLAMAYKGLGRYDEAALLLKAALKSDQENFGPNHPTVATSQSNLAIVYQALGRYEEAAQLLEEALKSAQENFGPNHPAVARNQSNLATVYKDLGRYDKAAQLLEAALKSDQANFGPNHPTVAIRQSNLATVYLEINKVDKAIELLQKAKQTFLEFFGPNHPDTITVQEWLDYAQGKTE